MSAAGCKWNKSIADLNQVRHRWRKSIISRSEEDGGAEPNTGRCRSFSGHLIPFLKRSQAEMASAALLSEKEEEEEKASMFVGRESESLNQVRSGDDGGEAHEAPRLCRCSVARLHPDSRKPSMAPSI